MKAGQTSKDPVLLKDDRVLQGLLKLEDCYMIRCNYFKIVVWWQLGCLRSQRNSVVKKKYSHYQ